MKRIVLTFAVLALLIGNYAYATTYTYTGDNFTEATPPYTTSMKVTGTMVTSSPIPSNSEVDISDILVSWSFNDGVQTISSSNGELNLNFPPLVLTNEQGDIIDSFLVFFSSPIADDAGETDAYIGIVFARSVGTASIVCASVDNGHCDEWVEPEVNYAQSATYGTWESDQSSAIPTLSQWSLMLLALMLGMVGIARFRRQV